MAAYPIPRPRWPRRRSEIPPCSACDGVVEAWAIPLDPRVPALCDRCQHANPTVFHVVPQPEKETR